MIVELNAAGYPLRAEWFAAHLEFRFPKVGFISIGCEPCTRPVLPNQHEREGRWWWEEATQKECGLHAGNLIAKS